MLSFKNNTQLYTYRHLGITDKLLILYSHTEWRFNLIFYVQIGTQTDIQNIPVL